MESILFEKLKLKNEPVAILLSDEKPEGALQSKTGKWSCTIPFFIAATKGKTVVFERETIGCPGAIAGLGFGCYPNYPDGIEYFISTGKGESIEGERYKKNPELGKDFVESLPITDIPNKFIILKPLSQVSKAKETPEIIVFYVNNDQLSALTVLSNYYREGIENVSIPFCSACQSIFLMPYAESKKTNPRAVVGLTDITTRPMTDAGMLSFAMPYKMFIEIEQNVMGSFLDTKSWEKVLSRIVK